jgi:hypothetical protein
MKVTKCLNRFEVIIDDLSEEDVEALLDEFYEWVKSVPTDEDYMAALGPCGK